MPEQTVLICRPMSYAGYVVPGSLPMRCANCDTGVWVSPASMLIVCDDPGMIILCQNCGTKCMAKCPGPIEPPTPAQLEEIEEYVRDSGGLR